MLMQSRRKGTRPRLGAGKDARPSGTWSIGLNARSATNSARRSSAICSVNPRTSQNSEEIAPSFRASNCATFAAPQGLSDTINRASSRPTIRDHRRGGRDYGHCSAETDVMNDGGPAFWVRLPSENDLAGASPFGTK